MLRRSALIVLTASLALGVTVDTAAAGSLSKRAALKKTGAVAKKVARQNNAAYWFAGACKRRSANTVACWGGVANTNGEGCIQKIVVRRARGLHARRTGKTYCGEIPSDSGSQGTGDGDGSTAVCAIRQSVCI